MISFCDVTTESQTAMDLQGLSSPTLLFKQGHLEQDHVQTIFENLAICSF